MSRSNLPPRSSDYRMPRFMNSVPDAAEEEAEEMALRHGVDEPRLGNEKKKPAPAAQKPAAQAEPAEAEPAKAEAEASPESAEDARSDADADADAEDVDADSAQAS